MTSTRRPSHTRRPAPDDAAGTRVFDALVFGLTGGFASPTRRRPSRNR